MARKHRTAVLAGAVMAGLLAAAAPATATPDAPSLLGSWSGFAQTPGVAGAGAVLDITAQQGRRFAGELNWSLDGGPLVATGTVSHETGASEGVNRVIAGLRPSTKPTGSDTVLQAELVSLGDALSGLDLLVGRFVRGAVGGGSGDLAALHLRDGAAALSGTLTGVVDHEEQFAVEVTFGGRTAQQASLVMGDAVYHGVHGGVRDRQGAIVGFGLVADSVSDGTSNTFRDGIVVVSAIRAGAASPTFEGTLTFLPADGGAPTVAAVSFDAS